MKVLFICGDNVGRSQAAEALFNKYAKKSTAWSCAGKPTWTKERDISNMEKEMPDVHDIVVIMKEDYGLDISKKVSKPFNKEMVAKSDRVIVMCDPKDCPKIKDAEYWNTPRLSLYDREGKREIIKWIEAKTRDLIKALGE